MIIIYRRYVEKIKNISVLVSIKTKNEKMTTISFRKLTCIDMWFCKQSGYLTLFAKASIFKIKCMVNPIIYLVNPT